MSRAPILAAVVLIPLFAAGCAGNRDNLAERAATGGTAAPTLAATPAQPATTGQVAPGTTPVVVDGNQLAARSADTLLCRELLVRGSNMIRKICGTAEQWKVYERREAEAAAATLRRMQSGRDFEAGR
jgi:hypothetical protein